MGLRLNSAHDFWYFRNVRVWDGLDASRLGRYEYNGMIRRSAEEADLGLQLSGPWAAVLAARTMLKSVDSGFGVAGEISA